MSPPGWYTPKTSRSALQISPTVASCASASRIGGSRLSLPSAVRRTTSRRARHRGRVAAPAQRLEALDLGRLELGADAQDLHLALRGLR